jgi:hypothetical protein
LVWSPNGSQESLSRPVCEGGFLFLSHLIHDLKPELHRCYRSGHTRNRLHSALNSTKNERMDWRRIITHPLMALLVVIGCCRGAKDFYPFNSFPMYADPGPEPSEFVVVRDGAGEPVDIQRLTGETSAKVKKKYVDARNELAAKKGIDKAADAPPEVCLAAWQEVAERLQRLAVRRKKSFPTALQLQIGMLYQESSGFREEFLDIGTARLPTPANKS